MPFTIGEYLVLPAAIKRVEILHGSKYGDDIRKIPLSNDTVSNRISDIKKDELVQLITRIKESSKFLIQLDETTDITKLAQLLVCQGTDTWNRMQNEGKTRYAFPKTHPNANCRRQRFKKALQDSYTVYSLGQ
ncbi:hypothetical protein CBL_08615 [Carabus blaptoides fortunei]